jgi:hypothetical protein
MNEVLDMSSLTVAKDNAQKGLIVLLDILKRRFGQDGVVQLELREKAFEEEYQALTDDERLVHIEKWATSGVNQDKWDEVPLESLVESACQLRAMRDFLAGSFNLLKSRQLKRERSAKEQKEKRKARAAAKSKRKNRVK